MPSRNLLTLAGFWMEQRFISAVKEDVYGRALAPQLCRLARSAVLRQHFIERIR